MEVNSCWWKNSPSSVEENSACKILWDFSLTADRPICHNRPDIVVLDKRTKKCYFVDVAIPGARYSCKTENY